MALAVMFRGDIRPLFAVIWRKTLQQRNNTLANTFVATKCQGKFVVFRCPVFLQADKIMSFPGLSCSWLMAVAPRPLFLFLTKVSLSVSRRLVLFSFFLHLPQELSCLIAVELQDLVCLSFPFKCASFPFGNDNVATWYCFPYWLNAL